MVSIIPVDVQIESTGAEHTHDESYFLDRIIRTNSTSFQKIGISSDTISNIQKIVETETKITSEQLNAILLNPNLVSDLLPDSVELKGFLTGISSNNIFVTKPDSQSLIFITSSESFVIMSKNRITIDTLLATLDTDFKKLGDITKDFGLSYLGLVRGEKYASYMLGRGTESLVGYKMIPTKNEFEITVTEFIMSLTDCVMPNIEISFESPEESFEYDVLIPFKDDNIIDIEVKDYTKLKDEMHGDSESLKSKLILSPIDKATRLGAKIIVVTRGFPSETFEQMREFASSRKIVLLNENNYKEELQSLLLSYLTKEVIQRQKIRLRDPRSRRGIIRAARTF